jgi:hypothetical protein
MLLARDAEAAAALRGALAAQTAHASGAIVPYRIAQEGLRVETGTEVN